ncbi:uncharacterized protein [Penaeus vannamei]|uniref:uncharacterized protein n=1 Tax=Penaeus vannamei TaxID=6689 RepID=UPI00387FA919
MQVGSSQSRSSSSGAEQRPFASSFAPLPKKRARGTPHERKKRAASRRRKPPPRRLRSSKPFSALELLLPYRVPCPLMIQRDLRSRRPNSEEGRPTPVRKRDGKDERRASSGNTGNPVTAGTGGRSHGLKLPARRTLVEPPGAATASGTPARGQKVALASPRGMAPSGRQAQVNLCQLECLL